MDRECQTPDQPSDTNDEETISNAMMDNISPDQARAIENAAKNTLSQLAQAGDRGRATSRYKVSRYDILVRLADGSALLFNSRSRSLVLLSEKEVSAYQNLADGDAFKASAVEDDLLLQALISGGHVVGDVQNELDLVQADYEALRGREDTLTLTIAPTMACNFGCSYCFQGLDKPNQDKMAREAQDAVIEFVKARKGLKSLAVVWYGGEPLMGKESIYRLSDRLIAWSDKNRISYSAGIVSNAYFLTAEVAAQLYSRRVKWVQITIDGDKEAHDQMRPLTSGRGTFNRIIENIGAVLDETPMSISVRVNVGQRNVDRVGKLLDRMAEHGFSKRGSFSVYLAAIEASTPESGTAAAEKLEREEFNRKILAIEEKARRLGLASTIKPPSSFSGMCVAASKNGYVISGNGDVHKCWETAHDSSKRIGTIFSPETLHESANANVWEQWSPFDNDTCRSCKILPMCGGHCGHRFIYGGPDETALPCPSWKWNTAEYIFSRAKDLGVVSEDHWLSDQATVSAKQSGERHNSETLRKSQATVVEKMSARYGRPIDHAMIVAGEAALEGDDHHLAAERVSASTTS